MPLEPPLEQPAEGPTFAADAATVGKPASGADAAGETGLSTEAVPQTPVEAPAAPGKVGLYWSLVAGLIVVDQIAKMLLRASVPLYETRPIINGFLDFVHVRNEGVAFGLLNSIDLQNKWVLTTALASAALAGIAYYARHIRAEEKLARIGLSMILGGAIGNLIDRVYAGYVLDFIDVYWGEWHFWAFNVADASISIGAVLVFVDLLLVKPHASNPV